MGRGKAGAMRSYNEFQVKQLTRLIEVTRTNLSRADRQKVGGGAGALAVACRHALCWCISCLGPATRDRERAVQQVCVDS